MTNITLPFLAYLQAPAKTAVIFKELRNLLNLMLIKKLSQPSLHIQGKN